MRLKAESIIGLIVLIAIGLLTGLFFSVYSPEKYQEEIPQVETPIQTKETPTSNFTILISMGQNVCEGCHLSGKKFIPQAYQVKQHAEGGAYCLMCHSIDHNVHPINSNVTCERCHGPTPRIPAFRNGTIACAECHDFPDSLKPSNGNLVVIHRPRKVDCMRCHTDSCSKCHDEIKSTAQWEKRIAHFKALLKKV